VGVRGALDRHLDAQPPHLNIGARTAGSAGSAGKQALGDRSGATASRQASACKPGCWLEQACRQEGCLECCRQRTAMLVKARQRSNTMLHLKLAVWVTDHAVWLSGWLAAGSAGWLAGLQAT